MGVSRIGILFAANADSVRGRQREPEETRAPQAEQRASASDDAAIVSASARRGEDPEQAANRAARIEQLKSQIRRGSYNVNSAKLALSVFRDLM